MNFWETFRKAPIDIAKWWQWWRSVSVKYRNRYFVIIPDFSVSAPVWLGSSYITTEFRLTGVPYNFTLMPNHLVKPDGVNFCLAVRWPANNGTGLDVVRYKLWEDVGERLVYPLYNGEVINKDAVFEVWTTPDSDVTSLVVPYVLYLSILRDPNSYEMCCSEPSRQIEVIPQYCELFANQNLAGNYDIPIQFNYCFDEVQPPEETFYRITETDDIRATETDLRVWR